MMMLDDDHLAAMRISGPATAARHFACNAVHSIHVYIHTCVVGGCASLLFCGTWQATIACAFFPSCMCMAQVTIHLHYS